jgi:hypothetical protein
MSGRAIRPSTQPSVGAVSVVEAKLTEPDFA